MSRGYGSPRGQGRRERVPVVPQAIAREGNISLSYPMLNKGNYSAWCIKMESYMKGQGVWEAVMSEEPVETRRNKMALAFIFQGLSDETVIRIGLKKSAKEAWETLRTMHLGARRAEAVKNTVVSKLGYPKEVESEKEKVDVMEEDTTAQAASLEDIVSVDIEIPDVKEVASVAEFTEIPSQDKGLGDSVLNSGSEFVEEEPLKELQIGEGAKDLTDGDAKKDVNVTEDARGNQVLKKTVEDEKKGAGGKRKHMMRNQVRNLLNVLSPKERKIIKLRFKTNGVKKKVRKKKKKKKKKLYMKNVQAQQLLHEGPVFVEKDEGGRRSRVQTPAHGSDYKFSKCPKEKRKKKIRYEYPEDEESNNDKSRRAREKIRS